AGIGRVFCDRLAARGHDLIALAREAGRLDAVGRELATRHGVRVEPLRADLTHDDEIARVAERIRAGPALAVLVNNAGFGTRGRLAESDPAAQSAMLHLHTLAPMRLSQAALRGMLARRAGAIVNVSSVASFIYAPGNVNYCATKAYLTVFSEGLAAEVAGTGVRVQALCPGFTRTEFHQRMGLQQPELKRRRPWMTAEYVVDYSLRCLDRGGPVVCVPDWRYKALVALLGVFPRRWLGKVTAR
ncbi:MAG TPA: SDR family oxidoreductase, partial [Gemmatimonadales bacterium]|nr:SDR family oxidoreductase [Gemmatimonadales bacterium]